MRKSKNWQKNVCMSVVPLLSAVDWEPGQGGGRGKYITPKCCVNKYVKRISTCFRCEVFNFIQRFCNCIKVVTKLQRLFTASLCLACTWLRLFEHESDMAITLRTWPKNVRMLYQNFIFNNITLMNSLKPCQYI